MDECCYKIAQGCDKLNKSFMPLTVCVRAHIASYRHVHKLIMKCRKFSDFEWTECAALWWATWREDLKTSRFPYVYRGSEALGLVDEEPSH